VSAARDSGLFSDAIVMVQREVAERLCGTPGTGEYGPLSILAQTWADLAIVLHLPPGAFRPPPKVASAVVTFGFRRARVRIEDVAGFERVVRTIFLHRRKTLANCLRGLAHARGTTPSAVLAATDLDGRRRPETLAIEEFARLAHALGGRPNPPSVL
jgi:16S rRNA (adenine1518-N6/adenine1519-N6)-dimethyltransferase